MFLRQNVRRTVTIAATAVALLTGEARAAAEEARHLCAEQGDQLLTAGQLESLKQIAPTDNAAALSGIRMFA